MSSVACFQHSARVSTANSHRAHVTTGDGHSRPPPTPVNRARKPSAPRGPGTTPRRSRGHSRQSRPARHVITSARAPSASPLAIPLATARMSGQRRNGRRPAYCRCGHARLYFVENQKDTILFSCRSGARSRSFGVRWAENGRLRNVLAGNDWQGRARRARRARRAVRQRRWRNPGDGRNATSPLGQDRSREVTSTGRTPNNAGAKCDGRLSLTGSPSAARRSFRGGAAAISQGPGTCETRRKLLRPFPRTRRRWRMEIAVARPDGTPHERERRPRAAGECAPSTHQPHSKTPRQAPLGDSHAKLRLR